MIKKIFTVLLTLSVPIQAMQSSPHNLTHYKDQKKDSSDLSQQNKHSLKDLQRKQNTLKEALKQKPEAFWMWTPHNNAGNSIYKAENDTELKQIIACCSDPNMRIHRTYSILGAIILNPNIPFQEKKTVISMLLSQSYRPTTTDKELDLVRIWEQCEKKEIIKKRGLFIWMHAQNNLLQQLPQEIIRSIAQLMVDTEGSLL